LHKEGRGDAISFLRKEIPRKIPGIDHPNNWNWNKKNNTFPQSCKLVGLCRNNK
jgi:hypothetical protein